MHSTGSGLWKVKERGEGEEEESGRGEWSKKLRGEEEVNDCLCWRGELRGE